MAKGLDGDETKANTRTFRAQIKEWAGGWFARCLQCCGTLMFDLEGIIPPHA